MGFKITGVHAEHFPAKKDVELALEGFGLSEGDICAALSSYVTDVSRKDGEGFQKHLAASIEDHIKKALTNESVSSTYDTRYSPSLNEKADIALRSIKTAKRLYFEIEFRPNVEKDLVKFQIGHNKGNLIMAVLVLAYDRTQINPDYATMPEYDKFRKVIRELNPPYPLLMVGIAGEHY